MTRVTFCFTLFAIAAFVNNWKHLRNIGLKSSTNAPRLLANASVNFSGACQSVKTFAVGWFGDRFGSRDRSPLRKLTLSELPVQFVACDHRHSDAMGAILNNEIVNSTAIYDYEPRSKETIDAWIASKQAAGLPIIGVESLANGELMGFATFGPFRPWAAYQYSIEHSVYVDSRFRGQGIGRKLLEDLMVIATSQGYHMMIGVIDSENVASIQLHKSLGFTLCAEIREAGFKFDRWLDLVFYQRLLSEPAIDRK